MDKIKVIVTALPPGVEGAVELKYDWLPDGSVATAEIVVPDTLKLTDDDGNVWRARLRTSTPISAEMVKVLNASGASWHFDLPDDYVGGSPV